MKRTVVLFAAVILTALVGTVAAQGDLSVQVLQLLSRVNTWTSSQTFQNIRISEAAIPSDTTDRLYADASHVLYWHGSAIGGAGASLTPHNLLSSSHSDTLAGTVVRGDVIVGNSTPAWSRLAIGTTGYFLRSNGTDAVWATDGSALTSLTAANLTGALPAISGASLTALNADSLSSGTVPLARISGLTNSNIANAAAIAYSKLALTGSVDLSADTAATALPFAKGGTGLTTAADDTVPVSSGAAWVAKALPNCANDGSHGLTYDTTTNSFTCSAITVGTGTVTSVALTVPAILSVTGSPVTTTGTLAVTLATEAANKVFAGPTTGADATPTFRSLVNADFPVTGVVAGTWNSVTVNAQGLITTGAAIDYSTAGSGTLPKGKGGTGNSTSPDDTVLVGNGSAWVAQTLPSCSNGPLAYTTSTNLFSCATTVKLGGASTSSAGYTGGLVDSTSTASGTVQNTEYTLNSITVPASAFNANTRGVTVDAWGTTAANGDTKNLKIYFGSVAVATVTGSTASGKDFYIHATVVRTGSSTQAGFATIQIDTGTSATLAVTTALAETDTNAITIAVKSANTASAAASATGKGMMVSFTN